MPSRLSCASGQRGPAVTPRGKARSSAASVSVDGCSAAAAAFSSSQRRCLVPGSGTMKGRRLRSQANASCAGVQRSWSASSRSGSQEAHVARHVLREEARMLAPPVLGAERRLAVIVPVRKPRPSGA